MVDYVKISATCKRLIDKNGRDASFKKFVQGANPAQPWKATVALDIVSQVDCKGVFVIPQTSIPTESRGLAFDWVDHDLLKTTRHVVMIAAEGLPEMEDYHVVEDSGRTWKIVWGQCLQPADRRMLYVFGLQE